MNRYTLSGILTLSIALLVGTAPAQDTIGTTAVGTTNYPTSGYEFVSSAVCAEWSYANYWTLDSTNNVMYIVESFSFTKIPLPLGTGAVQTTEFGRFDGTITGIAVDPTGGFLYLSSSNGLSVYSTMGRAEKPVRVGRLNTGGYNGIATSVTVNTLNGDIFVGTYASEPGTAAWISKYQRGTSSKLPTLVGSTQFVLDERVITSGFIDGADGYGVFVTRSNDQGNVTRLVKIALGGQGAPPQRLASSLWATTQIITSFVGNAPSDSCYASYVGSGSINTVIRFDVSGVQPLEVATFSTSEQSAVYSAFRALGTDLDGSHVCTLTYLSSGDVLFRKIDTASMTEVGTATHAGSGGLYVVGVFNPTNGRAYITTARPGNYSTNMPNNLLEVDAGSGTSAPTKVSFQPLPVTFNDVGSVAVDTASGHAFVAGTSGFQRSLSKVACFPGISKPPEFSSTYWENPIDAGAAKLAFDPINRKLYRFCRRWVASGYETILDKFEPGSGGNAPTPTFSLHVSQPDVSGIAFDFDRNEAYFGYPALKKVRLGLGDAEPTVVSTGAQFGWSGTFLGCAVDSINHKLYLAIKGSTVKLAKYSLGEGDAPPTLDGIISGTPDERVSQYIAVDPQDGYGVLLLEYPVGRIVRFSVDGTTNAPVVTGVLDTQPTGTVSGSSSTAANIILDTAEDAIFSVSGSRLTRYDTGGATGSMSYGGATDVDFGTHLFQTIVPSGPGEFLVGSSGNNVPTSFLKFAKRARSMKNHMRAIRVIPQYRSTVDSLHFYSHAAKGKLNFAIYGGNNSTLWASPVIDNTVAGGEIVVPVTNGLILEQGQVYYLGFVSDSDTPVASFVEGPGTSIAAAADLGLMPTLRLSTLPIFVGENWSIYATVHRPPGVYSVEVRDKDGANSPQVGFTNQREVLVVAKFGEPLPEMVEISDDQFSTSTIQPYAETLPFTLTRTTDGPLSIQVRGITGGLATNIGTSSGTLDTTRPTAHLDVIGGLLPATNSPTASIRMTISENPNHAPDPTNPSELTLTNCTAGPAVQVATSKFEFTITHLGQGLVDLRIPPNGVSDRAGNPLISGRTVSYLYDTVAPRATISVPLVKIGPGNIEGTYSTYDATSSVRYYYVHRLSSGSEWSQLGLNVLSGNKLEIIPLSMDAGPNHFTLRVIDQAGNENLPYPIGATGSGMAILHYNPVANAPVTQPVTASGAYFFAMEDDVLVRIDLEQVSGSGTLTVSREEGDLGPFAGTGEMIHERLNISYTGFTFGSASLQTSYQDDNLVGLNELSIYTAARIRGTSAPVYFPITLDPSWNRITVNGITSLRDSWYFGRMSSPAGGWEMYE